MQRSRAKYWEIIADRLSKAGWSLGWVLALDFHGRTISIVDAQRERTRFVVHANEKLTAFVELERAQHKAKTYMKIRCCLTSQIQAVSVKHLSVTI